MKLQVEYLDIDSLIPYENNPRINENAVEKVADSIKEFGFKNPIIIDSDNVIVAGHTRMLSAKKLGLKEVPIIRVDDLTENQIRAFRIADNKTTEFAEWDIGSLKIELEELMDSEVDILTTAFTQVEIDGMFDEIFIDDFFDEESEHTPKSDEPKRIICQCCNSILDQTTGEVIVEGS